MLEFVTEKVLLCRSDNPDVLVQTYLVPEPVSSGDVYA